MKKKIILLFVIIIVLFGTGMYMVERRNFPNNVETVQQEEQEGMEIVEQTVSKKINAYCTLECTVILNIDSHTKELKEIQVKSIERLEKNSDMPLNGIFETKIQDGKGIVYYNGSLGQESISTVFNFVI